MARTRLTARRHATACSFQQTSIVHEPGARVSEQQRRQLESNRQYTRDRLEALEDRDQETDDVY